jgi:protoporphyrinogen oxidase
MPPPPPPRRRVLVVGGGAAGTAAAWALSRSRERFEVCVWEASASLGGVATSETLKLPDGSSAVINDGARAAA